MRNRVAAIAASAVLAGSVVACTSAPAEYTAATPQITVTPSTGCPQSLGSAADVHNAPRGLRTTMMPSRVPSGGVVCIYSAGALQEAGSAVPRLVRKVLLSNRAAERLSRSIRSLSLRPPRGTFNCPAQPPGEVAIIAFGYADRRTVDLWYVTAGCRPLDNGYVQAARAGDLSF